MKILDIVTRRKMNQPYRHAEHFVPQCKRSEASQAMPDTLRSCQFLSLDGRGKVRVKSLHSPSLSLSLQGREAHYKKVRTAVQDDKKNHQKGFTLMEILVVMAVGGMIMAAGLLTMYQVIWGTARTNDQVRALTDANVATMWLKFDLQMVQETPNLVEGVPSNTLSMTWTNQTTSFDGQTLPVDHTINYARSGNNLVRTYDGSAKTIGRNITSVGFTRNGDYINVAISATGPGIIGRTQTLAFSVYVKVRTET